MATSLFSVKEGYLQRSGTIPGTFKKKYYYLDSITGMLVEYNTNSNDPLERFKAKINVLECHMTKKNGFGKYIMNFFI